MPFLAASDAPQGRREALLKVDVVVGGFVRADEGCLDDGVVVALLAHFGSKLVGGGSDVELGGSVRWRWEEDAFLGLEVLVQRFEAGVRGCVFGGPVSADVLGFRAKVVEAHAYGCLGKSCALDQCCERGHSRKGGVDMLGSHVENERLSYTRLACIDGNCAWSDEL